MSRISSFFANARRGRLLASVISRANGNIAMVDASLTTLSKSSTPIRLSVRHHITTEVHGLFLPCKIIRKS